MLYSIENNKKKKGIMMKHSAYKKEIILIASILVIAALLYGARLVLFSTPPGQAEISVDGEVVKRLDLKQNAEFLVEGFDGGSNLVVVKDGGVCVFEASCPDKICVHQGIIRQSGQIIVCLPNRVMVQIVGN